jgi:lactoylglutathione lyase
MADFGIQAVYETHIPVADLARSVAFYRDIVGLTLAREIPARNVAFFWVGDKSTGMLGLWGAGSGPLRMVQHFAFRMGLDDVIAAVARLRDLGVTPLGFSGEPVEEPVVIGWMPAVSVYISDPDGHSIEFIAVLDEPADADFGIGPYSDWLARGR